MQKLIQMLGLLALLLSSAIWAAPARAETMTFPIQSTYDYQMRLEFYTPQRGLYWPGNGKSWLLDDYEAHSYKINCQRGEQVCYGAWDPDGSLQWGVGHQYSQRCTNCCYICKGGTTTRLITLRGN